MEVCKNKKEYFFIFILITFIIFSRIFFFIDFFNDWDPINFALSLNKFNILKEQPHPPGYPSIVLIGKIINFFTKNELISLQILSLIFSILSVIIFYLFLKDLIKNRFLSFLYTLIFSISPIFFYYGTTPDIYVIEAFLSLIFSFFGYLTLKDNKFLIFFVIIYGLIGSFRFNDTIFFLPFFLFILLKKRINIKNLLKISILIFILILLWYIPVNIYGGGFKNHSFHSKVLYSWVLGTSLFSNVNYWQSVTFETFLNFIKDIFIPLSFIFIFINRIKKDFLYFVSLIFLSLIFYFFIHAPKVGYYLTIIPIIYLLFFYTVEKIKLKRLFIFIILIPLSLNSLILFKSLRVNLIKDIDINKKIVLEVNKFVIENETCIFISDDTITLFRHLMWYIPKSYIYFITPTSSYISEWNLESGYIIGKDRKPFDIVEGREIVLDKNIKRVIILSSKYEENFDIIYLNWVNIVENDYLPIKIIFFDIDEKFEYIFLKGYKIYKK